MQIDVFLVLIGEGFAGGGVKFDLLLVGVALFVALGADVRERLVDFVVMGFVNKTLFVLN